MSEIMYNYSSVSKASNYQQIQQLLQERRDQKKEQSENVLNVIASVKNSLQNQLKQNQQFTSQYNYDNDQNNKEIYIQQNHINYDNLDQQEIEYENQNQRRYNQFQKPMSQNNQEKEDSYESQELANDEEEYRINKNVQKSNNQESYYKAPQNYSQHINQINTKTNQLYNYQINSDMYQQKQVTSVEKNKPPPFNQSNSPMPKRPVSQQQVKTPSPQTSNYQNIRSSTSQGLRSPHRNNYKPTKEQLIQEREEKLREECTFQPRINENSQRSQYHQLSQDQKLKRLSTPKSQQYVLREKKKFQEEQKVIKEQCTFTPTINKTSRSISQNLSTSFENVVDRLNHEADLKYQQRERLKRQIEDKEFNQYKFTPQINSKLIGNKGIRPPIYMRIDQVVREKQENVNRARIQQEEREQLTFKPAISPISNKLAQQKFQNESNQSLDVVQRLVMDAQQKLEKQQSQSISQEQSCTFKPQILDIKIPINDGKSFYQRQQDFQEQKALHRNQMQIQAQENICTFSPSIDYNSRYIAESIKKCESENKFQKLSNLDNQKKVQTQKKIEQEYYQQFTFEPKINKISSYIGRSASFDILASNEIAQQNKIKIQQEEIEKQCKKYTFKPQTTKMSKYAESRYVDPVNILDNIEKDKKKSEERLQQIKKNMEYEELKDCTFQPTVLNQIKTSQSPVIVRGLGRYLDLQEQAKKKVDEQKSREEKVFYQQIKYQRDQLYTVPTPFNLSKTNDDKKVRRQQQIVGNQMKECTFRPQINK